MRGGEKRRGGRYGMKGEKGNGKGMEGARGKGREKGGDGMVEDGRKEFILWGKKPLKHNFDKIFNPGGSCTTPLADQCQI